MKKIYLLALVLLPLALASGGIFYVISSPDDESSVVNSTEGGKIPLTSVPQNENEQAAQQETQPEETKAEKITIHAMGDMLPHETVNANAKTASGYDYTPFFSEVKADMAADLVFCNQESPSAGAKQNIAGYPSFNAPEQFAKDLNKVGCNLINLANNHMADRGAAGIAATLDVWSAIKPLAYTGANKTSADQGKIAYFEKNGVKFALIAFTDLTNNKDIPNYSVNMFSDALVTQLATEASKNADIVISSAHWGTEYSATVDANQEKWARLLAKNGVDIIFGTGPHVLQTVDTIKNGDRETVVFYSLGNFLSSQLEIDQLVGGIASVTVDPTKKDSGFEISFTPTYMHYDWTAAEEAAQNLLARKNLKLLKLSKASDSLAKTRFGTSVDAQTKRVTDLLNQRVKVTINK